MFDVKRVTMSKHSKIIHDTIHLGPKCSYTFKNGLIFFRTGSRLSVRVNFYIAKRFFFLRYTCNRDNRINTHGIEFALILLINGIKSRELRIHSPTRFCSRNVCEFNRHTFFLQRRARVTDCKMKEPLSLVLPVARVSAYIICEKFMRDERA